MNPFSVRVAMRDHANAKRGVASIEDTAYGFAAMRDVEWPARLVRHHHVRIEAQKLIHRRAQIARRHGELDRIAALPIAAAMHVALLDAAAREETEAALRPMVASGPRVDARRPAHVAVDHDQRRVPQAALLEILE